MPEWTDRHHHTTPKDRFIIGRFPDGSEATVTWNPVRQEWEDFDGRPCNGWTHWREIVDE